MNAMQQPFVALAPEASAPRTERRSRYFHGIAILLLAITLLGFSRTLFLRPLFQVPALPWYVYVHGSVMTLWFVLLVTQTSLIAAHRTALHRRLGVFGAGVAVAVALLGIIVTLRFPIDYRAMAGVLTTGLPGSESAAVGFLWADLGAVALFSTLVAVGVRARRRPDIHKRLLLLASMAMISPAAGRITNIPVLLGAAPSAPINTWALVLIIVLLLGLPLSLVLHDLLCTRRVHRATLWGVAAVLGVNLGTNVVVGTAVGRALWNAL